MALKHIKHTGQAANLEAARRTFGIDAAIEQELVPAKVLKYIEHLERELSVENYLAMKYLRQISEMRKGK